MRVAELLIVFAVCGEISPVFAEAPTNTADGGIRTPLRPPSPDGGTFGSLEKSAIKAVINQNRAGVRKCYEEYLARPVSPLRLIPRRIGGKIAVKLLITASGAVGSAEIAESSFSDDEFEKCLTTRVLEWVFPKPNGNGVVIVTYPFVFSTSP